jgi:hypothetical protein
MTSLMWSKLLTASQRAELSVVSSSWPSAFAAAEEKAKDLIFRIFLGALRRRITMTVHATLAVSGPCSLDVSLHSGVRQYAGVHVGVGHGNRVLRSTGYRWVDGID